MRINNFTIEDFRGGISGQRKRGPRGSFKYGEGLNIHKGDNILSCNQALTKDSGTVVTDLILTLFRGSDGAMYGFGDTGCIYRKPSGGTWSKVYTDTDGKITGAIEYENNDGSENYPRYIYWATQTKLKRIKLDDAGGTWSPTTVGTFEVGEDGDYHTMRVAAGWLMVADGDRVAIVDREDAFNNQALRIATGNKIKALLDKDEQLIMGTQDDTLDGWLFVWNRLDEAWRSKTPVQDKEVNMMGFLEGGVFVQVGREGTIKYWNFSNSNPLKEIPGAERGYPGAVEIYKGMTHIGINGEKGGVYSLGRKDKNEPLALNLEYIPSHGNQEGEIGALGKDGSDLYVSWKNGGEYGIDKVDKETKANGTYESLEFDNKRPETTKKVSNIKIVSKPIPAGCEVKVYYRTNRLDGWVDVEMQDGRGSMGEGDTVGIFNAEAEGESYEVKVELISSGNNSPEVYSINNLFQMGNIL